MKNPPKEMFNVLYNCLKKYNKNIKKDYKLSMMILSSNQYWNYKFKKCPNHGYECENSVHLFYIGKHRRFSINRNHINEDCLGSGRGSFGEFIKQSSGAAACIAALPTHLIRLHKS